MDAKRKNGSWGLYTILLTILTLSFTQPALAELKVIPVPWSGEALSLPHSTYNGVPTIFKAIARGGTGSYDYEWDFNGDGVYDTSNSTTNPYDLSATHAYPNQSSDRLFFATIRVTSGGETDTAQYPVYVHVDPLPLWAKVNKAIDDGLWYLHVNQTRGTYPDGADYGYMNYSHPASCTGAATETFEIQGHLPEGDYDNNPYVETVQRGLNYLLNQMHSHPISMQIAGDPDTNGNGIGLGCYTDSWGTMYECGITLMTFASSLAPDRVAQTGPTNVVGRPYKDIVQDMIDYLAYGQSDPDTGNYRGGWRYQANFDSSDNSCSQWPVIGMEAAETQFGGAGVTVPPFVKDELSLWIDYIQNDSNGGSGYTAPEEWVNVAKTGGLLCEMKFYGDDTTVQRVIDAANYIDNNWQTDGEHFPYNSYYAFYSVMKGFRLLGIEYISPLNDPTGFDWYRDPDWGYAPYLVNIQNANGSWPIGNWSSSYLSCAWAVLILQPHPTIIPPVAIAKASPKEAPPGAVITFDHSGSYHLLAPDRTIVVFRWDFDNDGTWDLETANINEKPTFQYWDDVVCNDPGVEHLVILEVEDDVGNKDQDKESVVIKITKLNNAPVADGDPTDSDPSYTVSQGGKVLLDASDSYDPDEIITGDEKCDPTAPDDHITKWEWDLDNDGTFEAEGETYLFDTPDHWEIGTTHTVQLRVTDDGSWAGLDGGGPKSGETTVTILVVPNNPPDCTEASASVQELWPPNHKYVDIEIVGVTDPDGDPVTITITGITQDEPVDAVDNGDGNTSPDGTGVGTSIASVRAEREGTANGRVYEISFTATDPAGAECSGSVTVCVPHDQRPGHECTDDGQNYDSTEE